MIDLVLDKALEKCGSAKVLAIELGKSPSDITKFRSGDAGFKLHDLRKLFEISGLNVGPAKQLDDLKFALRVMSGLYLEESESKNIGAQKK